MQSSLILYIRGVNVGTVLQQKLTQLQTLHGIYQASAAVVVGPIDVGPVLDEILHNFQVSHETGAAHGSWPRVRHGVDVSAQSDQELDDGQLSWYGRAPQGGNVMYRSENAAAGKFISFVLCTVRCYKWERKS